MPSEGAMRQAREIIELSLPRRDSAYLQAEIAAALDHRTERERQRCEQLCEQLWPEANDLLAAIREGCDAHAA